MRERARAAARRTTLSRLERSSLVTSLAARRCSAESKLLSRSARLGAALTPLEADAAASADAPGFLLEQACTKHKSQNKKIRPGLEPRERVSFWLDRFATW